MSGSDSARWAARFPTASYVDSGSARFLWAATLPQRTQAASGSDSTPSAATFPQRTQAASGSDSTPSAARFPRASHVDAGSALLSEVVVSAYVTRQYLAYSRLALKLIIQSEGPGLGSYHLPTGAAAAPVALHTMATATLKRILNGNGFSSNNAERARVGKAFLLERLWLLEKGVIPNASRLALFMPCETFVVSLSPPPWQDYLYLLPRFHDRKLT